MAAPLLMRHAIAQHQITLVPVRNLARDGEAQAGPLALGARHAVEALEHMLTLLARNAGTVVFHLHEGAPLRLVGRHAPARLTRRRGLDAATQRHHTALGRVVQGVDDQIAQQFTQPQGMRHDAHRRHVQTQVDVLDSRSVQMLLQQGFAQILQVHGLHVLHLQHIGIRAREGQQLVHQLRSAARSRTQAIELLQRHLHDLLLQGFAPDQASIVTRGGANCRAFCRPGVRGMGSTRPGALPRLRRCHSPSTRRHKDVASSANRRGGCRCQRLSRTFLLGQAPRSTCNA